MEMRKFWPSTDIRFYFAQEIRKETVEGKPNVQILACPTKQQVIKQFSSLFKTCKLSEVHF